MKKNLSVLLVVAMAITSLTACGSKSEEAASDAASGGSSTEAAATAGSNDIASLQNLDKLEVKALDEINPSDYITLGEYKGLTVEVAPASVTDEDVDGYINNLIEANPAKTEITDRPIQKGDIANIDYEGKYADTGVAFEGGTAQGFDLDIGSGMFIPGFEDGLVGVNLGDTVDLDLTFPEEYGSKDLAGKKVVFTVKVNKISEKSKEPTDEWAAGLGMEGVTNLEQLKETSKKQLTEEAEATHKADVESAVIDKVIEISEYKDFPQEVLNYYLIQENQQLENYAQMYTAYGQPTTASDIVRMMMQNTAPDQSDPDAFLKNMVNEVAQQFITFAAIAKNENLAISDEDVENYLKEAFDAGSTGYSSLDELKGDVDSKTIKEGLMADKVVGFLVDNANVVEPAN
ncbi:trigger factor [Butyrivibrio hungatei]|uniref:peptidylprolyl isomerase n=1 Tax=Butyrivibrio hungatei TaxID=185008 RepID=A0A1G5FBS2_9FIRM|nr:trigger factor [Butyrivibrio hungatei]SCY36350.1 trigger factor [Butyrivibrio hungatei]